MPYPDFPEYVPPRPHTGAELARLTGDKEAAFEESPKVVPLRRYPIAPLTEREARQLRRELKAPPAELLREIERQDWETTFARPLRGHEVAFVAVLAVAYLALLAALFWMGSKGWTPLAMLGAL